MYIKNRRESVEIKDNLSIKENDEKYRKLFERANDAILILNSDFVIVECNAMTTKLLNRSINEIVGSTPVHISPKYQPNGNLSSEMIQNDISAVRKGKDLRFEWVLQKKDGTEIPVEVFGFGFVQSNKEHAYVIIKDLTEIKKKSKKLIESEERFRTIYSQAADGILLHEPSSNKGITDCNEAAYKILGYNSKKGIVGKSILDISPELQPGGIKSKDIAENYLKECMENGQTRFEWIHSKKDGSPIWFDIVLTKITYLDKTYVHTLWRDITKVKNYQNELLKHQNQLEDIVKERTIELETANEELNSQKVQLEKALIELKETESHLVHSEKMASLGVLTAGVAHEINNPLNYIMGGYEGIMLHFNKVGYNNKQIPVLLNAIKTGIDKATSIVKGLNQFSRDNETKNESCDIHSILDNCLLMLNNRFEDEIQIVKNYSTESVIVSGNVGQLHQVFINIITNANQAIQTEGKITILTKMTDKNAAIEISDTGRGIRKENLSKITEPFFTTKAPGKGTGLGLSICYSIIMEHKGLLEFESEIGKGTKARIVLPIKEN